jgi:hypothetical protein
MFARKNRHRVATATEIPDITGNGQMQEVTDFMAFFHLQST